ncbi:MAG: hypothetical protein HQK53_19745, partial [Oligoflexia bacterium]|nr:hypothetical protein [Oligoflexia bacterium]
DEGIKNSLQMIASAFFKILVLNPLDVSCENLSHFKGIEVDLLVLTHSDLPAFSASRESLASNDVFVSTKYGLEVHIGKSSGADGTPVGGPIGPLEEILFDAVKRKYGLLVGQEPIILERHRYLIKKIFEGCSQVEQLMRRDESSEMPDIGIVMGLVDYIGSLISELIGSTTSDDVLKSIFENFCIGK